jgi:VWFA-related protein
MTRWVALGTLTASVWAVAGVAGQQQPPTFRAGSDTVRVYATVLDDDGRLVTNLRQDDFEVRDDGKVQPITLFDNTPAPIRLVVMLDVSGSMEGNLPLLRSASQQLFSRLLPGDRARLGTFGKKITISPEFTNDRTALLNALPEQIERDAGTPLWRAIYDSMDTFKDTGEERAVVLVLSDGHDSGPMMGKLYTSQGEAIDRARRDAVMVYAVGMRSRGRPVQPTFGIAGMQSAMMADLPDPGMAKVAEESGGGYTEVNYGQDLGRAFAEVAEELHSQYLIGFTPPKRDGKTHRIDVRVTQKGMKPRARKNYVAPKS